MPAANVTGISLVIRNLRMSQTRRCQSNLFRFPKSPKIREGRRKRAGKKPTTPPDVLPENDWLTQLLLFHPTRDEVHRLQEIIDHRCLSVDVAPQPPRQQYYATCHLHVEHDVNKLPSENNASFQLTKKALSTAHPHLKWPQKPTLMICAPEE